MIKIETEMSESSYCCHFLIITSKFVQKIEEFILGAQVDLRLGIRHCPVSIHTVQHLRELVDRSTRRGIVATEGGPVYFGDHEALVSSRYQLLEGVFTRRPYRHNFSDPVAVTCGYSIWVRYDGDIRVPIRNCLTQQLLNCITVVQGQLHHLPCD